MRGKSKYRLLVLASTAVLLSGCASVPDDRGIGAVEEIFVDQWVKRVDLPSPDEDNIMTDAELISLLDGELSLADAEAIAIRRNPLVRAILSEVGVSEADYAQAARLENPGFSFERFSGEEYSSTLLFDIGGLLLMPLRRDIELRQLRTSQLAAAGAIMDHIAETREAWIRAVAEKQQTAILARVLDSAAAGNQLTRQMSSLGHSSTIEAARSEMLLSQLQAALAKQKMVELSAMEDLVKRLGLWGLDARRIQLPDTLPALPDKTRNIVSVEQEAIENRLDVRIAVFDVERMASNYDLTRRNPFLSAIELGPVEEVADGESEVGFELELRIPVFDPGGVQNEKARIIFEQAQARAEVAAITAASESRVAYLVYNNSWAIADQYEKLLLPLRQRISQEQLLMYNGMLISVFDLLADVRSAAQLETESIMALRDFWLAETSLMQALTGTGRTPLTLVGAGSVAVGDNDDGGH